MNNAYIISKHISSMAVMCPSPSFPPAPHPARPCLVHVDQEGINEVLRGPGVQPLDVLKDKMFHFLNFVVHSSVGTRKVFQDAGKEFTHLQGRSKELQESVLSRLVLQGLRLYLHSTAISDRLNSSCRLRECASQLSTHTNTLSGT